MEHSGKNFPQPTVETQKFWDGCRNHQLMIQQCVECGHNQFYPRIMCTQCSGRQIQWIQASGRGTVKSFTIIHRAISPAYQQEAPYVLALIQLEEGPTMMSNILQCDPHAVEIGMKVEVFFEDWSSDITVPQFRLI